MTTPVPPAQRLTELLETLPADERRALTTWLLGLSHHAEPLLSLTVGRVAGQSPPEHRLRQQLALGLPAGEENQLVTIRLPSERHGELRTWCAEHNFTMAAVVRGLVERFLEQQRAPGPAAG